jgi:hypothetical protein
MQNYFAKPETKQEYSEVSDVLSTCAFKYNIK